MSDTHFRQRIPLRLQLMFEAFRDLWRDYHWPTKLAVALLLASCVLGAILAGWPSIAIGANPAARSFSSDAMRTLLTLAIGLFIAVNFYARARRGVLDGDEHYNVARALAFGYFKNFLVPALQLAAKNGAVLHLFRPESMADLRAYGSRIEPRIRERFEHEWLPLVEAPRPGGPPRRTVLAIRRPIDGSVDERSQPFYFDAPTALFTIEDFYAALNRRREEQNKEPINASTQLRYQNGQIFSFFSHLDFLFSTSAGLEGVGDLIRTTDELAALRANLRYVTMGELDNRYPLSSQ